MLTLTPIPALKDNYIWALHEDGVAWLVDPGEGAPAFSFLSKHQLNLEGVLCTHHHADHTSGIAALKQQFQSLTVVGPKHPALEPRLNVMVGEGDTVELLGLVLSVLAVPGHTLDHIVFYGAPYLFCGDTLFGCGCGRVFEGSPEQLYHALQRLARLPPDTQICCGHEYTVENVRFALTVDPNNQALQKRYREEVRKRNAQRPTLPSTLLLECATNPFLRTAHLTVEAAVEAYWGIETNSPLQVFTALRRWKDTFRAA